MFGRALAVVPAEGLVGRHHESIAPRSYALSFASTSISMVSRTFSAPRNAV
jgi:hypothetical protein